MQEKYLIWSIEHNAWWKSEEWGYTQLRKEAGIYSRKRALELIKAANIGNNDIPNEAMILIDKD